MRNRLRGGVGGARIVEPQIVLDHRKQLRCEVAALRLQVPRPLPAITDHIGQRGVEEHDRLGAHPAVLHAPETERIDVAGSLGSRHIQKRRRIGKPRAVHVQAKAAVAGKRGNRRDFVRAIGAPILAGLGDRNRVRLHLVHIVADRVDHRANRVRRQLGTLSIGQHQLGPVKKEARRAALVHFDMRLTMADHAAVRGHHRTQRKAIGRSARCDPQHRNFASEKLRKPIVELLRMRIAVIRRIGTIGGTHRLPHLRMHAGGIVGEKSHWNAPKLPGVRCKKIERDRSP